MLSPARVPGSAVSGLASAEGIVEVPSTAVLNRSKMGTMRMVGGSD